MQRYDLHERVYEVNGGFRGKMFEAPDGEWVKWRAFRGHKRTMYNHEVENMKLEHEIQDRMREICTLMQNADGLNAEIISLQAELKCANVLKACNKGMLKATRHRVEDGAIEVVDVTECNCMDRVLNVDFPEYWICPKHGYTQKR